MARTAESWKTLNPQWVQINTGREDSVEVRCRVVAQELWYEERLGELFVAPRVLAVVKTLLAVVAERDLSLAV